MNIIRMTGGLGNQMFQYALYLKYRSIGIEAKFDDWTEYEERDNARPISLGVFDINYPRATKTEYNEYTDSYMNLGARIRRKLSGRKSREYLEKPYSFDEEVLKLDNAYVSGYFQSEKYFADIREEVLSSFVFNENTKDVAKRIFGDIPDENTVSIHIRRGDYLAAQDIYGNICTEKYYDKCVRYILEKKPDVKFLVFSNDSEWTQMWKQKYISEGVNIKSVQGTTEDTGYVDMYLMSNCAHHIIANSSFSWWGSYLSTGKYKDGIILAPSKWNNVAEQTDIYTDRMIIV